MRPTEDTYRHKGLRQKLTDIVRSKGISDDNVLTAINKIPRHFFLDSAFDEVAYEDRAFPISSGQTISQPYTVAYQTQLLEVKPFMKVLFRLKSWIFFAGFPIGNRVKIQSP